MINFNGMPVIKCSECGKDFKLNVYENTTRPMGICKECYSNYERNNMGVSNEYYTDMNIQREYYTMYEKENTDKSINIKAENNGGSTDYYKIPEGFKDCQDIIEWRNMNFSQGNIFKAAFCFNIKRGNSDYLRDLNKIIWFAEREIARLTKGKN